MKRTWSAMPKAYMRAAGALVGVGMALVVYPLGIRHSFLIGPAVAAVVFTAFQATYVVWRFQSRRHGDAA